MAPWQGPKPRKRSEKPCMIVTSIEYEQFVLPLGDDLITVRIRPGPIIMTYTRPYPNSIPSGHYDDSYGDGLGTADGSGSSVKSGYCYVYSCNDSIGYGFAGGSGCGDGCGDGYDHR